MEKIDSTEDYVTLITEKKFDEALKIISNHELYLRIEFQDEHNNTLLHITLAQFVNCSFDIGHEHHETLLNYLLDNGFNVVAKLIQVNGQGLTALQYMYDLCKKSTKPDYTFLWNSIEIIEQKLPVYFTGIKV